MGREGRVRICDFGLAKAKRDVTLTQTGSTLGTVAYMSPEQAQGMEVDQRSDIFSLGVVLYEMITGRLPFEGEHEAAVINSIVNDIPEPLARYKADVPEALQRIVEKALRKDASTRYQSVADVLADLKEVQKETVGEIVARPKKKFPPYLIGASTVFLIALLLLILKPFRVDIGPEKEAVARENSLAIMYFENMVDRDDSERLGEIVTNLLITDLSESEYMRVVSSQRLYDILKLLGKEGDKVIDKGVASEVAREAKAKWMLLGNILKVEPQVILTAQLVEVATGNVIASQRIEGDVNEEIFPLVDRLTVEIKSDLTLPAAAQQEPDLPVADVTTHSPEAYRYYLEGVDYYYRYYSTEAGKSFASALEFDSTFAMAYFWSALVTGEQGRSREQKELIAKAVKYSDKVSWKEKHYIKSMEARISGNLAQAVKELQEITERCPEEKQAFLWSGILHWYSLGDPEGAVTQLTKAIEIDPLYKFPYNVLAYAYNDVGDFEKSIWAINKYISLAPDEANPYDSRADLYAYNGKLDQATESYKKALEMRPDFYMSLAKLGHMCLFKREYAKAESCYQQLSSSTQKRTRSQGRTYLAYVPLYQGKFEEALEILDRGVGADRMEQAEGWQDNKHILKASIHQETKHLDLALKELEAAMEISRRSNPLGLYWRPNYVHFLAETGSVEKAEEVAEALRKDIEEKDHSLMPFYWWAIGCIELSKDNLDASVTNFEKAAEASVEFYAHFMLAKACLASDRLGEAVAELEKALSRYDANRAFAAIWTVKAHYLLGLAYEKSGWDKKAIEKYEEFLEIWRNADPGIPEVEDARERLAKLRVQS
jgi:tetratricopeptide (TPR) repeat protein